MANIDIADNKFFSAFKDNPAKIITPVICALLIGLSVFLFIDKKNTVKQLEAKRASLLHENLDLKDRLALLESRVKEATSALNTSGERSKDMENELTSLKAEYEKLNKANQGLLASAEEKGKLEEKINLLEGENGTLKKKIANLENKPAVEKLKDSISSEKNPAVKKILEGALRDITMPQAGSSVNLDEILVKKDTGAAPAGMAKNVLPKDGKVISLDTRNKLVAVSLGQKDGIALNDKCIIVNANNELLANGTIISLRYQLSAVSVDRMKEKFRFEDIKKGDWVFISKR